MTTRLVRVPLDMRFRWGAEILRFLFASLVAIVSVAWIARGHYDDIDKRQTLTEQRGEGDRRENEAQWAAVRRQLDAIQSDLKETRREVHDLSLAIRK